MLNKVGKSYAAHEILFAMIEHLQMPHNCMLCCENILAVNSKMVYLCVCVDFVYVVSEAESLMYGGF
jgi:hypothetical protein